MSPLARVLSLVSLTLTAMACSNDWDRFDPRLGAGGATVGSGVAASGATTGSNSGGAGGQGTGGGGGAPPPLVDDGLLARYFLAEAASGTAPTEAIDAAPNPLALPILQDPVMSYVTEDGHRGLNWTVAGEPGGPRLPIVGTKILDLNGSTTGTIEAVARVEQAIDAGSRFVHIGFDTSWHFSVGVESAALIDVPIHIVFGTTTASGPWYADFDPDFSVGRLVIHAVFDTARALPEDRMRVYVNGTRIVASMAMVPAQNEPLAFAGTEAIALGNRLINGRSIHGTLFYGAYYLVAFDDAQIAQNASALLANDDGP